VKGGKLEAAAPWLVTLALLVVWQAICSVFDVSDFIFPSPYTIALSLVQYAGPIAGHAWQTFWTTMIGFAIGVVVGLALGGGNRHLALRLQRAVSPAGGIQCDSQGGVRADPRGVVRHRLGSRCPDRVLISFFPIVVNVATGLATLEPELEDVLRSLGATKFDILWKVGLPRSLPYFFASLKVSITLAFIGTVVSETVASNQGIGYLMMSAGSSMRMPLVFAGLAVIGVMAMAMYELFAVLERRMTRWAHRGDLS
jgi:NitT/TauT family transport system permease protein